MSEKATHDSSELVRLHQITRKHAPVTYEIADDKLRQFAREQSLTPVEMRRLIKDLLAHLPEPERMAFYVEIRTADMI